MKDKIIINGEEVEICKRTKTPLSDDDLEGIHGGGLQECQGKVFYRWICRVPGCGYRSQWHEDTGDEFWLNMEEHCDATNHHVYEMDHKTPPGY